MQLPGLWMQRITVKEPDDGMIEVAIAAMKDVIPERMEKILYADAASDLLRRQTAFTKGRE